MSGMPESLVAPLHLHLQAELLAFPHHQGFNRLHAARQVHDNNCHPSGLGSTHMLIAGQQ